MAARNDDGERAPSPSVSSAALRTPMRITPAPGPRVPRRPSVNGPGGPAGFSGGACLTASSAAWCGNAWRRDALIRKAGATRRSSGTGDSSGTGAKDRPPPAARGTTGRQAVELGVPDMNRSPMAIRFNADPGESDSGPASETSAPHATQSSWPGSRLGPGDAGILAAFAASLSALIVIWGVALGYIRF
jgi:hypothetical protein